MFAYGNYLMEWFVESTSSFGKAAGEVAYKITHDPLWGGVTVGIVILICVLLAIKARVSRQ
jgi:hypothetical protein